MQKIVIEDYPHQIFTALLDGVRAEFEVQYNELCDRWYINLSTDDNCVGGFKIVNSSLLIRNCGPDDFGDLVAIGTNLGRDAFASGNLALYYVTPAEAEALQDIGY